MPLYEYQCEACDHRFEVIQKFSDPLVTVCSACGGAVRKLFSSPAIQFKGSGFYITDYAKKNGQTGSGKSESSGAGSNGKDGGSAKSGSSDSGSSGTSGDSGGSTPPSGGSKTTKAS